MRGLAALVAIASFMIAGCVQLTPTPTPKPTLTPTLTTSEALRIIAGPAGNGTVGLAYSQDLPAAGGSGTYSWEISDGDLPPGLTLNGGIISGTPTESGNYTFTVRAADSAGRTTTANLSVDIQRLAPTIVSALPEGNIVSTYGQALQVIGGIPPYTWMITGGALPRGLTLNAGVITGIPRDLGMFKFTIQVTDSVGSIAKSNLSINIMVHGYTPSTYNGKLADGEIGLAYSQQLVLMSQSSGFFPRNWSILSGSLPRGLVMNDGVISGTPIEAGTFLICYTGH